MTIEAIPRIWDERPYRGSPMPGLLHRKPAADPKQPAAPPSGETAGVSNSAMQDQLNASKPDDVYAEALKNAQPFVPEVDHRYDPPPGYEPGKPGKEQKPPAPKTADEMRKEEKVLTTFGDETPGKQSPTSWASLQYT